MDSIRSYLKSASTLIAPLLIFAVLVGASEACAQDINDLRAQYGNDDLLKVPEDILKPVSPENAVEFFQLAPGFKIELVASEPLISNPVDVCWDAEGQLYVHELHGYNLPGQLEIEAMNQTGVLDSVVQRVAAAPEFQEAARSGMYSNIRRLSDTNGDGRMDESELFAGNLPLGYGCTASREGLIVAGQSEIIYVADRDGDGRAEVRDTLFYGWREYRPERGVNFPRWGPDGWIYVSSSVGAEGKIAGKYIDEPVEIPGDFRIRADGSAIEPVLGSTSTIGHFFSEDDYRFTGGGSPAPYVIPIPLEYISRNPSLSIYPAMSSDSDYSTMFSTVPVHPWRLVRSLDPEWRSYYLRYSEREVTPSGYFTGNCCPLIYQDELFPDDFRGNLFASSPAFSLVHRALMEPDGTGFRIRRGPESEQNKEFLTSSDLWFMPIGLEHGPDGSLYIADFYLEIAEDYTAVPRPMQQLYGLKRGADMGRIWRVSPLNAESLEDVGTVDLTSADLERELDSPHYWRRETAERLLREREGDDAPVLLKRHLSLSDLTSETPRDEFIRTLRRHDVGLKGDAASARRFAEMSLHIADERMLLQLALSLGYSQDAEVFSALVDLARDESDIRWMTEALLTGLKGREIKMFNALLKESGETGHLMLARLGAYIGASDDPALLSSALRSIAESDFPRAQVSALEGINRSVSAVPFGEEGNEALRRLLESTHPPVRKEGIALAAELEGLNAQLEDAALALADPQLSSDEHVRAVSSLAGSEKKLVTNLLITQWSTTTPSVKEAILDVLVRNPSRHVLFLDALSDEKIPVNQLTADQRSRLRNSLGEVHRSRLDSFFEVEVDPKKAAGYERYRDTVEQGGDVERGRKLYRTRCTSCHLAAGGEGLPFGPDLVESASSPSDKILRDILWPNEEISPGYEYYEIATTGGQQQSGVVVDESNGQITLRSLGGIEYTVVRDVVVRVMSSQRSYMPSYKNALSPKEVADIVSWLHSLEDVASGESTQTGSVEMPRSREVVTSSTDEAGGRDIFSIHCASCHGLSGEGAYGESGLAPPLAGTRWVTGDEGRLIRIVLYGLSGPIDVRGSTYDALMPWFNSVLSDEEIAKVITYIRQNLGNDAREVTVDQVKRVREAHTDRKKPWTVEELKENTGIPDVGGR